MTSITFSDILDAADQLPLKDQEDLIRILENRLRAQKRAALVQDVQYAQQEFDSGKCSPVTPEQLQSILLEAVGSHDEVY